MPKLNVSVQVNLAPILQDAFDDFMDAKARELGGEWFDGKVAGITHRNEDGRERQDVARSLKQLDELTLEPEPHNLFDKNAIALITPAGERIGYLEARLAAEMSRQRARGGEARCFVRAVRETRQFCGVSFGLFTTRPRTTAEKE